MESLQFYFGMAQDLAVDWGRSIAVTGGWDASLIVWSRDRDF